MATISRRSKPGRAVFQGGWSARALARRHGEAGATAVIALGAILVGTTSAFAATTAAFLMVWVLMAQGWNLISGFGGPLALGQAAFFGIADFLTVVLLNNFGLTQYAGAAAGIVAAVAIAAIVGAITLQRPGFFFAIASLLVPLILEAVVIYFGYYEVQRKFFVRAAPSMFWFPDSFPYLVVGAVLVTCAAFGTSAMRRRKMGRFLVANRENGRAAESTGVPTFRYKMIAYMLSAVLAAIAGVIYAQLTFVFDPTDVFAPQVSIQALLVTLVGGSGTVVGPVVGGLIVVPAQQFLSTYVHNAPGLDIVLYALLLLVVAVWLPQGAYPTLRRLCGRLVGRGAGARLASPAQAQVEVREAPGHEVAAVRSVERAAPRPAMRLARQGDPPQAPPPIVLEVRGLTTRFGGVVANDHVSFSAREAERIGLIGPNGAGKTTLVNAMAGAVRPSEGSFLVGGLEVTRWQPHRRFRHGLGRTFQIAHPFPAMTAAESVAIAPLAMGQRPDEAEEQAWEALSWLNLSHLGSRPMRELNSVDAKLVELARLTSVALRAVLLDELLAGLVPGERRFVLDVVDEIAASRRWTVVMIEHLISDVQSFCPRTLVLVEGSIIKDGPTAEVLKDEKVVKAYLGERWTESAL